MAERPTLEGRIDELEIRTEFQARSMDELDAVVRDFADRVHRLERELAELRGMIETIGTRPSPPERVQ